MVSGMFVRFPFFPNRICSVADCLEEAGEALKQMAEVKYALEDTVKQNFLEPLTHIQNKDIRDVQVSCFAFGI